MLLTCVYLSTPAHPHISITYFQLSSDSEKLIDSKSHPLPAKTDRHHSLPFKRGESAEMVAISKEKRESLLPVFLKHGLTHGVSTVCVACVCLVIVISVASQHGSTETYVPRATTGLSLSSNYAPIRGGAHNRVSISKNNLECRFFLAESAIPNGGLGIYTAIDIEKGHEAQSMKDVCIYVADTPEGTQFETHSWAQDVFMGLFEGANPRAACEGVATLFNSMPPGVSTSKLVSMKIHSNAGLHRARSAGAGSITSYYGTTSEAVRDILAGSELTIDYGDWKYDKDAEYVAPFRTVDWLQKHGMCIDNIMIKQATNAEMGRGAFARRAISKGTLVAPAPLQSFPQRQAFAQQEPEALFVNYCFQPKGMDILFFPYGPGVNMINHSRKQPNVELRWSTSPRHHGQWLDLPEEDFWKVIYPGALILEVVALRDIEQGEELFIDYGTAWEEAWQSHVQKWRPVEGAESYVYPAEMNPNEPIRTIEEQKSQPYPSNLATACFENNWEIEEGSPIEWTTPKWWPEGLTYCHILKRERDDQIGSFIYEVSLGFRTDKPHDLDEKRFIDTKVPQSAIMFVDLPYTSDMHLPNAFRHPIALPDHLLSGTLLQS